MSFIGKSHYFLQNSSLKGSVSEGTQPEAVSVFSKGLSLSFLPAERRHRGLVPGLLCGILSSDYCPYSLLLDVQKEK